MLSAVERSRRSSIAAGAAAAGVCACVNANEHDPAEQNLQQCCSKVPPRNCAHRLHYDELEARL